MLQHSCKAMPRKKIANEVGENAADAPARMPRMSDQERTYMIDWLGLERPGDGKKMLNFRWIYGGAAKGQNMSGDASDVHASSGFVALANYVNEKAQIKSNKAKAWCAVSAEKRWTTMKARYRKAVFLPTPTEGDDKDVFEDEMAILAENREKVCVDFKRLHLLLGDHPSTAPLHIQDSMSSIFDEDNEDEAYEAEEENNAADSEDADAVQSSEIGSKRSQKSESTKQSTTKEGKSVKLSKQRMAEQKPFQLKKATSELSHKRTDIQTLFIKSQEDLVKNQKSQQRINAIIELIKAGIEKTQIEEYMRFMFGGVDGLPVDDFTKRTTIYKPGEVVSFDRSPAL